MTFMLQGAGIIKNVFSPLHTRVWSTLHVQQWIIMEFSGALVTKYIQREIGKRVNVCSFLLYSYGDSRDNRFFPIKTVVHLLL